MSEQLFEQNAAGSLVTFLLLNTLISNASEKAGIPSSSLTIISHPTQADMARLLFYGLAPEVLQDKFLNPLLRVDGWIEEPSMPRDEIRIETSKGVCRLYSLRNLSI